MGIEEIKNDCSEARKKVEEIENLSLEQYQKEFIEYDNGIRILSVKADLYDQCLREIGKYEEFFACHDNNKIAIDEYFQLLSSVLPSQKSIDKIIKEIKDKYDVARKNIEKIERLSREQYQKEFIEYDNGIRIITASSSEYDQSIDEIRRYQEFIEYYTNNQGTIDEYFQLLSSVPNVRDNQEEERSNENKIPKRLNHRSDNDQIFPNVDYRLKRDQIIQDIPVNDFREQTFETKGMSDEEIEESRTKISAPLETTKPSTDIFDMFFNVNNDREQEKKFEEPHTKIASDPMGVIIDNSKGNQDDSQSNVKEDPFVVELPIEPSLATSYIKPTGNDEFVDISSYSSDTVREADEHATSEIISGDEFSEDLQNEIKARITASENSTHIEAEEPETIIAEPSNQKKVVSRRKYDWKNSKIAKKLATVKGLLTCDLMGHKSESYKQISLDLSKFKLAYLKRDPQTNNQDLKAIAERINCATDLSQSEKMSLLRKVEKHAKILSNINKYNWMNEATEQKIISTR